MSLKAEIETALRRPVSNPGVLQGVRPLRKGMTGKCVGFFPSVKNGALMPFESRLEADHCQLLEFDTDVKVYRTQPLKLDLGAHGTYTPDVACATREGNLEIREVKFSGALEDPKKRQHIRWLKIFLAHRGIQFRLLTEKEIRTNPSCANQRYIYRASHLRFSPTQIDQAVHILASLGGRCPLGTLRNALRTVNLPELLVERLLFLGLASYDPLKQLTTNSILWITEAHS